MLWMIVRVEIGVLGIGPVIDPRHWPASRDVLEAVRGVLSFF